MDLGTAVWISRNVNGKKRDYGGAEETEPEQ